MRRVRALVPLVGVTYMGAEAGVRVSTTGRMPDPTRAMDHFKRLATGRDRTLFRLLADAVHPHQPWAAQRKAMVRLEA